MRVDLRHGGNYHMPIRALNMRYRGIRALGDGTCQVPQPGVTMVYPPCPVSTVYGTPAAATYVAPTQIPVPACISGPEPYSQECQQQLIAANLQNIAAGTAANYSVDRANCENDWAANDARYAALGLPRPPNDCADRTFGLTLPGTTGGSNILTPSAQQLLDPNYKGPVAAVDPVTGEPPVTKPSATGGTTTGGGGGSSAKTPANGGGASTPSDSPHELLYWTIGLGVLGILIAAVNR